MRFFRKDKTVREHCEAYKKQFLNLINKKSFVVRSWDGKTLIVILYEDMKKMLDDVLPGDKIIKPKNSIVKTRAKK